MGILIEIDFQKQTRKELIKIYEEYMFSFYEKIMTEDISDDEEIPIEVSAAAAMLDTLIEEDKSWNNKIYRVKKG